MKRRNGNGRPWAKWLSAVTRPAFFLFAFFVVASALGLGGHPTWKAGAALATTAVVLCWIWTFLNINGFALHSHYRNRLCECYLALQGRQQRAWLARKLDRILHGVPDAGSTESTTGIGTLQRLPLFALGHNAAAPYHLINATLNAAASKNTTLRGRDGDFFLFSRFFCGSPLTGYIRTKDLEKVDPHVNLGTAMVISGAAASTNMGWQTMTRYRFLLTLLPTNHSRAYAILVKIDYCPPPPGNDPLETSEEMGWMLYLKLAVTGTEPRYVLDYRRQNPTFPHQTTGDQFYDEAQFEAYRALGEAAVESLFREEVIGRDSPPDLAA